jgi:adenosylcobinamide hydrolase
MKFETHIDSVDAEVKDNTLVIWSKTPLKILSSAVLNGGFKNANGIINVQVSENCGDDKNDEHWNPENFLINHAAKLKFPKDKVVALMTAAKMQNAATSSQKHDKLAVTVFTTAGSNVAVTAGDPAASKPNSTRLKKCGTINIIVLVDANLTESCMVDAVKTVTEAKTVALRELDIRSRFSGEIASGTITDSVAVACTEKGDRIRYAGTATILGELIGKSVRETVKNAIHMQDKLVPNRPLTKRLQERGISLETIIGLSTQSRTVRRNPEKYHQLQEQMQLALLDKRIASLVLASLRFDDDSKFGLIPESLRETSFDKTALEKIVQSALRKYFSEGNVNRVSGEFEKDETALQGSIGSLTRSVLLALRDEVQSRVNC